MGDIGTYTTSENSKKIKEFTTTVLRKIRKVDYSNVSLIPGYERTELEYLSVRSNLNATNSLIKDLMSYEHGNRYIKAFKEGLQTINDKASLRLDRNMDVFESISSISKQMALMCLSGEDKNLAFKFSNAHKKISVSKQSLNEKLENLRLQLKEKRTKCLDIDKDRKRVKNMRFDLEMLLKDKGYNGEIRDAEKKEFFEFSSVVIKDMIKFLKDAALGKTLKEISKEYARHLKKCADILKEVN